MLSEEGADGPVWLRGRAASLPATPGSARRRGMGLSMACRPAILATPRCTATLVPRPPGRPRQVGRVPLLLMRGCETTIKRVCVMYVSVAVCNAQESPPALSAMHPFPHHAVPMLQQSLTVPPPDGHLCEPVAEGSLSLQSVTPT